MIDQERREVVADERDADVDEIPQPGRHDAVVSWRDDLDEGRGKELVAVEQEIVEEPPAGGTDQSAGEMGSDEFERVDVIARLVDAGVLLRSGQGGRRVDGLVVSEVG